MQEFGPRPRSFHMGRVGICRFADALQVWAFCQPSPYVTVGEAADAFDADPECIVAAVETRRDLAIQDRDSEDIRRWTIGHDG